MMPADPFYNLNQSFSQRLQAFIDASGGRVSPGSGFRTEAEQARLYNAYKAGVPGQARAAPPGRSQHNVGLAMDLQYGEGGQEWAHANAARYGLYFPMDDEPWHIQPAGVNDQTQPGVQGLQSAGVNPQDELASRMQSIMQILVGGSPDASTPEALMDDQGQEIQLDPTQLNYLNNLFAGGEGSYGQVQVEGGDKGALQQYAAQKLQEQGMGGGEANALIELWNRESGWNPQADNPTSSAAGIAQKMQSVHGAVESTGQGQIDWGLNYILGRYGSPSAALAFHDRNNWY